MPRKRRESHEKTTREILARYREIGHRPALEQWRSVVPGDARRAWIRAQIGEVGRDKFVNNRTLLRDLLPLLPPREQRQATAMQERVDQLEDRLARLESEPELDDAGTDEIDWVAEAAADARLDLAGYLEMADLGDDLLEEFSRRYFLTFDPDPQHANEFLAEQNQQVAVVARGLTALLERSVDAIMPVFLAQPMSTDQDSLRRTPRPRRRDLREYDGALVVYGSSAIGPRTPDYKSAQDLDLYVVPALPRGLDDPNLKFIAGCVDYLNLVGDDARRDQLGDEAWQALEQHFPEWLEVLQQPTALDLHTPELISQPAVPPGDWKKLCGPHRVAAAVGDDWERAYKLFLDAAVAEARHWAANAKKA